MSRSLEELVEMGWAAVDLEIDGLIKDRGLWMKYIVLAADGADYILAADEKLINDVAHKNATIARVRERVKEKNAYAVLIISDAWVSQSSSMDMKTVRRIEQMGIPEAVKQGLITSREAILCFIATPIQVIRLIQFYRREGKEETIFVEERKVEAGSGDAGSGGRLSHFFDHLKPVEA